MPYLLGLFHWGACRVSKLGATSKNKSCKIDRIVWEMHAICEVLRFPFVTECTRARVYPLPIQCAEDFGTMNVSFPHNECELPPPPNENPGSALVTMYVLIFSIDIYSFRLEGLIEWCSKLNGVMKSCYDGMGGSSSAPDYIAAWAFPEFPNYFCTQHGKSHIPHIN